MAHVARIGGPPVHTHANNSQGGVIEHINRRFLTGAIMQTGPSSSQSGTNINADFLWVAPWEVARPLTIDRLYVRVTTQAAAGKVARLGIYADSGSVAPGALVRDAGTVAIDAQAVVFAALAPTLSLQPGLYWLAYLANAAASLFMQRNLWSPLGLPAATLDIPFGGMFAAHAYGALPDPAPAGGTATADRAFVFPRLLSLD